MSERFLDRPKSHEEQETECIEWMILAQLAETDERNVPYIRAMHLNHWRVMQSAPGSTGNHQAWEGGYLEHIKQINFYASILYKIMFESGGFDGIPIEETFSLGELLTVTTLHDIEKPFRTQIKDGHIIIDGRLKTKADRDAFKEAFLDRYNIDLNPQQKNALRYVEGMKDADYSPESRVMMPMAAIAHSADLLSARCSYATPSLRI